MGTRLHWLVMLLCLACGSVLSAAPVYFVVAERPDIPAIHHDSYILPLEDSADIAHARQLINLGPANVDDPIVAAKIVAGSDGINRNVLASGEPLWSWHVQSFEGFAGATIEIVDSTPTYVEENLAEYLDDTGGAIGFWNYTVVAELQGAPPAVPLPTGLMMGGVSLGGLIAWRGVFRGRKLASLLSWN